MFRRAGLDGSPADFARFSSFLETALRGLDRAARGFRLAGRPRGIGHLLPGSARVLVSSESLRCVPAVHLFVLSL